MADEDSVLEEAMDNLKEAGGRIRATQSLMRSEGMTDGENYRDLLTRLSTALAMTEAAYLAASSTRAIPKRGGTLSHFPEKCGSAHPKGPLGVSVTTSSFCSHHLSLVAPIARRRRPCASA
jgi:hypothetical protein